MAENISPLDALSLGELKLLAAAFLNMPHDSTSVDWELVASEIGSKSGSSCRVRYNAIKRKLTNPNLSAPSGGVSKASPAKVKSATPKKATKAEEKPEDGGGNGGSPVKKRGRPSKKTTVAKQAAEHKAQKLEDSDTELLAGSEDANSDDILAEFGLDTDIAARADFGVTPGAYNLKDEDF